MGSNSRAANAVACDEKMAQTKLILFVRKILLKFGDG